MRAWTPYILLVVLVIVWGTAGARAGSTRPRFACNVPLLHNAIMRTPPVTADELAVRGRVRVQLAGSAGTATFLAAFLAALIDRRQRRAIRAPDGRARFGG